MQLITISSFPPHTLQAPSTLLQMHYHKVTWLFSLSLPACPTTFDPTSTLQSLSHAAGLRLELPFLDSTVQSFTTAGISWTTLTSGLSRFQWFCQHNGLLPFPLSESTLCQFVARLFNDHLTIGSVRLYLSGLQFFQITQGGVDFSVLMMPQLCYVLRDFS